METLRSLLGLLMLRSMPSLVLFCTTRLALVSSTYTSSLRGGTKQQLEIIGGQGDWKYRYIPINIPLDQDLIQDGHGLATDLDTGDFYYTFNPKPSNLNMTTQVLVRFSENKAPELLGSPLLSRGVPHGLRKDGKYLYHANNQHRVTKTTLDGHVIWTTDFSNWETLYPEFWPIVPTDAIVVPGTDWLAVADGYGSNYVHILSKSTGEYIPGHSFGGPGSTLNPLRFSTPHSISLDYSTIQPESPEDIELIVSDRSNQRLVWTTVRGQFRRSVEVESKGSPLPCNIDNSYVTPDGSRLWAVASLGRNWSSLIDGSVAIYKDEEMVSKIEVARLLGHEGHQHPHDAIFLPNGDLVVCCWSGPDDYGPSKGTISYWQKINQVESQQQSQKLLFD